MYLQYIFQTYAIKEKEVQRKKRLPVKQLQVIQQMNIETPQKQVSERRIINDQTFNIWKKQNMKLKKGKLTTYTKLQKLYIWNVILYI